MPIKEMFYDWLARKYVWSEATFKSLGEEYQTLLLWEFNEIRKSCGQRTVDIGEILK